MPHDCNSQAPGDERSTRARDAVVDADFIELASPISGQLVELRIEAGTAVRTEEQLAKVRYLDEVLSMGEVPRTFADFLDQRLRWMQGNIQIFFRPRELPIWSTLDWQQLSFYLNLAVSLLTPVWRLTYLLLPLLSLVVGFTLIAAPPIEYLAYGVPFVLLLHTLPSWLSNDHQFQFWNEVYETLFCVPGMQRMLQV